MEWIAARITYKLALGVQEQVPCVSLPYNVSSAFS
jgi:hypothetical protein